MRRTSRTLPAVNLTLRLSQRRPDPQTAYDRLLDRHHIDEARDRCFHEDMRFLLEQAAGAEGLSPMGWTSFHSDIDARILNRSRVLRLHEAIPQIREEVIERPIIVIGLPRTATTLAQRVLADAPGARGPLLWELSNTDLPLSPDQERQRIATVAAGMRMVARLAPAMRIIHLPDALGADECAYVLPHGEQHLARAPMPAYEQWLATHDFAPDYAYLKQVLQVLQHQRPKRRWVLKCPTHLGRLPILRDLFPEAVFVWLHRDPIEVTGSICSLVHTSRAMHLHRIGDAERRDIGRMAISTMAGLLNKARADRPQIPAHRIIDVPYTTLTGDPLGSIETLYGLLGLAWTSAEAARIAGLVDAGPGSAHHYGLTDYDLTGTDIDNAFGDYPRMVAALHQIRLPARHRPRERNPPDDHTHP